MGVDAETGVFLLLYLDLAYYGMRDKGLMKTWEYLREAILEGGEEAPTQIHDRGRHVHGAGPHHVVDGRRLRCHEAHRRPMVGGIFTSFLMELMVYPAIYEVWRWHFYVKKGESLTVK